MRLTKKLATEAMRSIGSPLATRASSAAMCSSATCRYASCENKRVTLMLIPSSSSWRIAGVPALVPGTLTIRLGSPTAFHRRRASSTVASVSMAR